MAKDWEMENMKMVVFVVAESGVLHGWKMECVERFEASCGSIGSQSGWKMGIVSAAEIVDVLAAVHVAVFDAGVDSRTADYLEKLWHIFAIFRVSLDSEAALYYVVCQQGIEGSSQEKEMLLSVR